MSYSGNISVIPMGMAGLNSDDPQTNLDNGALTKAVNVQLKDSFIEKAPGSKKWNLSSLGSGIVGLFEWEPSDGDKRLVAVTRDGVVHSFTDQNNVSVVAATGSSPTNLTITDTVKFVQAGNEAGIVYSGGEADSSYSKNIRKLFIFTGNDPVQVISSATPNQRADIAKGASDWSGSDQPAGGFVYLNTLWAYGNKNFASTLYGSNPEDHEDFQTLAKIAINQVGPGEGKGINDAFVYKGRAFILKDPGLYFIDDANDPTLSTSKKLISNFGAASKHSAVSVIDDMLIASSTGGITSAVAAESFGDIISADILTQLRVEDYMRNTTTRSANSKRSGIYYPDKKQVYFTYQSKEGKKNDRIQIFDVSDPRRPKVSWLEKDQPNILSLRTNELGVQVPVYGSDDGFIYDLDRVDREINGAGYEGRFETPHMDFGEGDIVKAELNKKYEFLEITYIPTGKWDLNVDVYIDSRFSETLKFDLSGRKDVLDEIKTDEETFGRLDGVVPFPVRLPLHGLGKRIHFKCYNSGYLQNFKIVRMSVFFKFSGQQAVR